LLFGGDEAELYLAFNPELKTVIRNRSAGLASRTSMQRVVLVRHRSLEEPAFSRDHPAGAV